MSGLEQISNITCGPSYFGLELKSSVEWLGSDIVQPKNTVSRKQQDIQCIEAKFFFYYSRRLIEQLKRDFVPTPITLTHFVAKVRVIFY